ncbi:hypothetical protein [Caulobacter endophyticus]|uniref:hypothetical protein n=1 Tax=Caulobacter endophyticus TaxID=2172652 RepID=UPI00240F4581|nr:hypothetical protein [Caulobacter endophyticus]MDG2528261.1 hypothetical protein [Caulobacter endophyticus]
MEDKVATTLYQIYFPGGVWTNLPLSYAGFAEELGLKGLTIAVIDSAAEEALLFNRINAYFGWQSMWIGDPGVYSNWLPGFPDADLGDHPLIDYAVEDGYPAGYGWRDDASSASSALVEHAVSDQYVGDDGNDWVFSLAPGLDLDGRGGGDVLVGTPGIETINGGAGDDAIYGVDGADILRDGDGADYVQGGLQATVQAAADGDNDRYWVGRVDYSKTTAGITIDGFIASSSQIGTDDLGQSDTVFTTGADDNIRWHGRAVAAGQGNDHVEGGFDGALAAHLQGGVGDDTLILHKLGGKAIGQFGEDVLWALAEGDSYAHELTGNNFSDEFHFDGFLNTARARQIVWDMDVSGDDEDLLFFHNMIEGPAPASVADAIGAGNLRIREIGGYTYLDFDQDGGGDLFDATITLKGVFGAALYDNIVFI